jgi:hypothetical protein
MHPGVELVVLQEVVSLLVEQKELLGVCRKDKYKRAIAPQNPLKFRLNQVLMLVEDKIFGIFPNPSKQQKK